MFGHHLLGRHLPFDFHQALREMACASRKRAPDLQSILAGRLTPRFKQADNIHRMRRSDTSSLRLDGTPAIKPAANFFIEL